MMKTRIGIVASIVCVLMVMGAWQVSLVPRAMAGPEIAAVAVSITLPMGDEAKYVGSSKCKKCHIAQHRTWKKTHMGQAFKSLMPGEKADAKKAHGVEVDKDYTTDETCLACHTTGYGKEGGYSIPDASDPKAVKKAKKLAGVGCESCHGPGGNYIAQHDEILKSKRKYKLEEMTAAGLIIPNADSCKTCHNEESPFYKEFDFEAAKERDTHDHSEMKQREG